MKIEQVIHLTNARIVTGNPDHLTVENGFCSDLMSDVLTIDTDKMLLITGMANVQAIRTAEMADVQCILMVRGKKATVDMIRLANENGMLLMQTAMSMFKTAGVLYEAGLKPVY